MTAALDLSLVDPAIRPQDDLFRHANGTWLATATIDDDKALAGAFVDLRDTAERQVRDIITGLDDEGGDTESDKIARLYACFMDVDHIEELGAAPLRPHLDRVAAISGVSGLSEHLGWSLRNGIAGLFGLGEDSDPDDPNRYVMFLGQGGLGLPDEEYYRLEEHREIRDAYLAHLQHVLGLAGLDEAGARAGRVLELETAIAAAHWDKVRNRDLRQMHNPMTWDEMTASAPGIDWDAFLRGAGIDPSVPGDMIVAQPSFITAAAGLVAGTDLEAWRDWAAWKVVASLSSLLSAEFVDARFDFYERTLMGTVELRPRWKRGVALVEGALGEAVGKVYVERHFPPNDKAAMDELVANLLEAYRRSITTREWMTDDTRAEALDKLSRFTPKIGHPEHWRDYSRLTISRDDLVGNAAAVASFELDRTLERWGQPMDRDEWLMFPQTVNAYYHPLRNEIVFPAAILQPPFFNPDADDAINYGAIGAVIGHEIGHGFDDKGSTCDGHGRIRDWWTEADRAAFEERTRTLVGQYEVLSPEDVDGARVNGELTLGENIGDLGGLGIAYRAWLLAGGDPQGDPIDGLTPAQRFFLGWAAIWRTKIRPAAAKQRLATDPHSPAEFRCNQIVKNLDAFHAAFDTTPDDALWLEPADRVTIW